MEPSIIDGRSLALQWGVNGGDFMIKTGDKAPGFTLADHLGRKVSLESFQGQRHVMLLLYPLDWTPT